MQAFLEGQFAQPMLSTAFLPFFLAIALEIATSTPNTKNPPGGSKNTIIGLIYSAVSGKPIPGDMAAIGETGLTGEIRNVSQIDKRISELAKMGFKRCIVPSGCKQKNGAELLFADNLADVIRLCFGGEKGEKA